MASKENEDRARELLDRLDSEQFKFTATSFEQRVADRKLALEIIAAAFDAAEARGVESTQNGRPLVRKP